MTKELTPLEALYNLYARASVHCPVDEIGIILDELHIIETELKEKEKLEEMLNNDEELIKKLDKKVMYQDQVLQIIKEKKVDVDLLLSSLYVTHYNDFINEEKFGEKQLTQKEFNLLKEVLL